MIAAAIVSGVLWLNLMPHASVVQQLSAGVSSSIRAYFKDRQAKEATGWHTQCAATPV
jgi:hypothetical protein